MTAELTPLQQTEIYPELTPLQLIKLPLIGIQPQLPDIIKLLQSNDINEHAYGITALWYCIQILIHGIPSTNYHIVRNAMMELVHFPGSDLSIKICGKSSPLKMLLTMEVGTWRRSEMLDIITILLETGISPDVSNDRDGNMAASLIKSGDYRKAQLLLEYGADPMFDYDNTLDDSPLHKIIEERQDDMLELICKNTKVFRNIESLNEYFFHMPSMNIIYDNILQYGKIETLEHLGPPNKKILEEYAQWIETMSSIKNILTIEQLRGIYYFPLQKMTIDDSPSNFFIKMTKMILFKHNLEAMIGLPIRKPMYVYYDIVIVFVYLLKKSWQVGLDSDTLKMILYYVFQ